MLTLTLALELAVRVLDCEREAVRDWEPLTVPEPLVLTLGVTDPLADPLSDPLADPLQLLLPLPPWPLVAVTEPDADGVTRQDSQTLTYTLP